MTYETFFHPTIASAFDVDSLQGEFDYLDEIDQEEDAFNELLEVLELVDVLREIEDDRIYEDPETPSATPETSDFSSDLD